MTLNAVYQALRGAIVADSIDLVTAATIGAFVWIWAGFAMVMISSGASTGSTRSNRWTK